MKLQKRVERLEAKTMNKNEDVPNSIPEIYALEDNPETDIHNELKTLYNPNKSLKS